MIALDTNVLLRMFTHDNIDQAARAERFVKLAQTSGEAILINDIVLAETVWTMARTYKARKADLIELARALLDTRSFTFESRENVTDALELFKASSAQYADCLIAVKNHALGARETLSFDEGFGKLPASRLL